MIRKMSFLFVLVSKFIVYEKKLGLKIVMEFCIRVYRRDGDFIGKNKIW